MSITDVLLTFAQAAMVIAGFGGIVITLHERSQQWGEWDRIQFRSILEVSGIVVFFSLLPLVIQSTLDADRSWRVSILLFAAVHAATIISYRLSVKSESVPTVFNRLHAFAGALIILQLISGVLADVGIIQLTYSIGLFWLVGVGGWLFYLLALGRNQSEENE